MKESLLIDGHYLTFNNTSYVTLYNKSDAALCGFETSGQTVEDVIADLKKMDNLTPAGRNMLEICEDSI